jgi:hypothetical protein
MITKKENKTRGWGKKDDALKPDPETLHTTDPQEKMEGPISSIVQNVKEEVEEDDSNEKYDNKKK